MIDVDDDGDRYVSLPVQDAALDAIAQWPRRDYRILMGLIKDIWHMASWGWHEEDFGNEGVRYSLSTGGWSGNESIINALSRNQLFWWTCWVSSRRGGHYVFEVPRMYDGETR